MKNLTKLIELIEWFNSTADEFTSPEDVYEYTHHNYELLDATYNECREAFYFINKN